jgi:prophage regulatory protein
MNAVLKRIYLDLPEVAEVTTLATATIQKLVREDAFPKPRQLSGRRVAWLVREIEEWAEQRPTSELLPPANTGGKK